MKNMVGVVWYCLDALTVENKKSIHFDVFSMENLKRPLDALPTDKV